MPKVVFVEAKRGVLKGWTHFKRDRPDLSIAAIMNRLMDIFNVRTMNFCSMKS
jgi:hypothetical protein